MLHVQPNFDGRSSQEQQHARKLKKLLTYYEARGVLGNTPTMYLFYPGEHAYALHTWLWSTKAPLSAARSMTDFILISHTVL